MPTRRAWIESRRHDYADEDLSSETHLVSQRFPRRRRWRRWRRPLAGSDSGWTRDKLDKRDEWPQSSEPGPRRPHVVQYDPASTQGHDSRSRSRLPSESKPQ
jgi:hypothetical protein